MGCACLAVWCCIELCEAVQLLHGPAWCGTLPCPVRLRCSPAFCVHGACVTCVVNMWCSGDVLPKGRSGLRKKLPSSKRCVSPHMLPKRGDLHTHRIVHATPPGRLLLCAGVFPTEVGVFPTEIGVFPTEIGVFPTEIGRFRLVGWFSCGVWLVVVESCACPKVCGYA